MRLWLRSSAALLLGLVPAAWASADVVTDVTVESAAPLVDADAFDWTESNPLLTPPELPHLTPVEGLDDPSVIPAQREELITGSTPVEEVTRARVQQQQQAALVGQAYGLPAGYGAFTLVPGYGFGAYQPFYTTNRWFTSVAQTVDYVTNLALPFSITPNTTGFSIPRRDDYQYQTNVYTQYRLYSDQKQSLTTAFNYYQSLHPSDKQIDLWSYASIWRYTRVLSDRVIGFWDYAYTYYLLNHQSLLSQNRTGPGLFIHANPCVDWQVNYIYADNNLRLDPNQSSTYNAIQTQRYRYLSKRSDYLLLGYIYGRNDAALSSWSYNQQSGFAGARWLWGCCNRNEAFLLTSYGNFAFMGDAGPQGQPNVHRTDNIWTLTARVARPVTNHLSVFAQYTYFNSQSNVFVQNFDSHIYSIGGIAFW